MSTTEISERPPGSRQVLFGLAVTSGVGGLIKFVTGLDNPHADEKVPLYYFLAAGLLLLLPRVKQFSFGELKAELNAELEKQVERLELDAPYNNMPKPAPVAPASPVVPGTPTAPVTAAFGVAPLATTEAAETSDDEDPHAGTFGGSQRANGRVLEAELRPVGKDGEWVDIRLTVRAEDADRQPLTGSVTFHLHPTFPYSVRSVPVRRGQAVVSLRAYGVFTVGVEADGGETRLELDLAKVPGGSRSFYEN